MDTQQPTVRVSGPADLVAAVPHLLGFVPRDSLVLVGVDGSSGRVKLTARVDLPPGRRPPPALLDRMVTGLARSGAQAAVLLFYVEDPQGSGLAGLGSRMRARLQSRGIATRDVLLVWSGRFRSLVCEDPRCCPPEGRPAPDPAASPLAAGTVLTGRAVLPDRDAVLASIDPAEPAFLRAVAAALARAERSLAERLDAGEPLTRVRQEVLEHWRVTLREVEAGDWAGSAEQIAMLLTAAEHCPSVAVAALVEVVRGAGPQQLAAAGAALAWHAYLAGDGCLAAAALDRAQTADPTYSLAVLLRTGLEAAVPPSVLGEVLEAMSELETEAMTELGTDMGRATGRSTRGSTGRSTGRSTRGSTRGSTGRSTGRDPAAGSASS